MTKTEEEECLEVVDPAAIKEEVGGAITLKREKEESETVQTTAKPAHREANVGVVLFFPTGAPVAFSILLSVFGMLLFQLGAVE